ncbi:MAG: DNA helicase RecQ [Porphyromonas sp.]|nr:DNA helicase RecQ [Porphyromonas sp.]
MQYNLEEQLNYFFGFDRFKGNQKEIIESLIQGRDSFVLMPTGSGKSLCYQLPALLMPGTAIVVSPLIALMKNQVDAIRAYGSHDGIAHVMNSSLSKVQLDTVKKDITEGRTKLLYVAPESLGKEDNMDFLTGIPISFYAIDEAHCISEWGHDFRPEYRRIRPIIDILGRKPIIALTATATPKVEHDILKNLEITDGYIFRSSFNRPNLFYRIRPKTKDIDKDIVRFILSQPKKSGIVYCTSRNKVTTFAQILQANGIKALPYHAGMDAKERAANQDAFLTEECDVVVATIAFGMGIDKPDVRYVIHYDMPKSLEGYYQETGRAGRDGGEGICIGYYCREDIQKLEKFMQGKSIADQEIGKQLLAETSAYAETQLCRRTFLLHYFGEIYDQENCGCCDNCTMPKKLFEAKELLTNVLETIKDLKGKFDAEYVVDILVGNETSEVETYDHQDLDVFGCGAEEEPETWHSVIRQAIMAEYIKKDVESYGLLTLTEKGKKFLKKPVSFSIIDERSKRNDDEEPEEEEAKIQGGAGGAVDPVLYSMMKDLRKKIGQQKKVPPYVIFQDPSLEAMATFYPITMEELQNIPGVGAGKAQRYGKEFLDLIKRHVEDNEIDRPEDLRVRTLPNKSKMKVSIVHQIDHKVALEDIAFGHSLEFDDLLTEIESIVYSGTRIKIDYFLEEIMDEEHIEEIYDYFKNSTTDSVEAAMEEFDGDYSEREIRLVRIKFMSDMAN